MAGQSSAMFGWSWTKVSQVLRYASMESCAAFAIFLAAHQVATTSLTFLKGFPKKCLFFSLID